MAHIFARSMNGSIDQTHTCAAPAFSSRSTVRTRWFTTLPPTNWPLTAASDRDHSTTPFRLKIQAWSSILRQYTLGGWVDGVRAVDDGGGMMWAMMTAADRLSDDGGGQRSAVLSLRWLLWVVVSIELEVSPGSLDGRA